MKIRKNVAISDSGFIFNPDTGESYTANPLGLEIVELIRQGLDFESIRRHILERYRTDKDTVEKDYHDFLQMLDQYNLIDHDGKEEI